MERLKYLDFELKFKRKGNSYSAHILQSPSGEASGVFKLPFSEDKLENLVLKLGRLRGRTRCVQSPEMEAAREFGGKLFDTVFSGDVRACFMRGLDEAQRQPEETGLRIKLHLQDTPELDDLPWEFLFDRSLDRFLAQSGYTPIVRYIELPERIRPLSINLPLRLLVMISNPVDPGYASLDVEKEKSNLETALEPLRTQGMVQIEWLEKATLRELMQSLVKKEYHIFHYIGHGGFDTSAGEGVLVLKDEDGRSWLAGAHRIGTALHDCRSLRLAILNSCEGARNTRSDPFAGMASTLVRQGIPAVVAMQFEITDQAAITFSSGFYEALAEGFPVDAALAQARKAIYCQPNDVEWGTPVLYMRSPDGKLFDVKPEVSQPIPHTVLQQPKLFRQRHLLKLSLWGLALFIALVLAVRFLATYPAITPNTYEQRKQPELHNEVRQEKPETPVSPSGDQVMEVPKPKHSGKRAATPGPLPKPEAPAPPPVDLTAQESFERGRKYSKDKNYGEAVKWFRKAAEQGLAEAQAALGNSYWLGWGVQQDDVEAIKWFRKAAEQGNAAGQFGFGYMYVGGRGGVPRDYDEAVKWIRKAAEQGLMHAQQQLGFMYENGMGVPKNDAEAVRWYRMAAKQGLMSARDALKKRGLSWSND